MESFVIKAKLHQRGDNEEKEASFLKLFESQVTRQVFQSQYSNTRILLRVSFMI